LYLSVLVSVQPMMLLQYVWPSRHAWLASLHSPAWQTWPTPQQARLPNMLLF
jgi:hypothetical protein